MDRDFHEFKMAIRKGGRLTQNAISDQQLEKLFGAIDGDGSGDVSIKELATFVWGEGSPEARNAKTPPRREVADSGQEMGFAQAVKRTDRSNQHAEAEAADPMLPLKKKLRGLSYGDKGQDPRKLFSLYDKDNSGEL